MRLNVRAKVLGGSLFLIAVMVVAGVLATYDLWSVREKAEQARANGMAPAQQLASLNSALLDKARAITYGVVVAGQADGQATVDSQIAADDKIIDANLAAYEAGATTDEQRTTIAQLRSSMAQYQTVADSIRAASRNGDGQAAASQILSAASIRARMMSDVATLANLAQANADRLNAEIDSTFWTGLLTILILVLIASAAGVGVSLVIARGVSNGAVAIARQMGTIESAMGEFTHCLEGMAANDLTREYKPHVAYMDALGHDEIGDTAESLNSLLGQLKKMVGAYETSRNNLIDLIGEIKNDADSVSRTSVELDQAANQTGAASQQVAQTISQVAFGASDQARAANATAMSTQDLTATISEVSQAASETQNRAEEVAEAVAAAASAVHTADHAGDEMKVFDERVKTALANGIDAVGQTSAGMRRIKDAVETTAARVGDLGSKSGEIGAIVETISDIAEQTNLLALNAAIEAARAGEQGKGFAVVADEVRKLAERSSQATTEIADLIAVVQGETERAVSAMNGGAREVQAGSELAEKSASALTEIQSAAAQRDRATSQVFDALVEIGRATSKVVSASDAIATIAVQTNSSAEHMMAAAGVVNQSVESIAAISQENSAAAEEVSAATEEMSAQAEEVVASAATLAQMATQLEELVRRFRIGSASSYGLADPSPRAIGAADLPASSAEQARAA